MSFGGSNSYSARGYVDCGVELLAQLPELDHVIVALGSGATMDTARALAGLIIRVADGRIKPEHRTVFLHTVGLPGLFGHPELAHLTGS
ncbi:MAG TPA: hypothetical protein VN327_04590 [Pseudonocardiaceae bacterium]|jgi:D-cysteine desulfhydrase|nr:hypothetical protein [Pseudonocardiaceae bacterium]